MKPPGIASVLLGLCICGAFCQTPPAPIPGPVQAELIAPLNVRRLEPGKTVFARVTLDWKGLGCTLRSGATLEGTGEVAERRKGRDKSQLALSFTRAQCNGPDLKFLRLLLAAVADPPADWKIRPTVPSTCR